MNYWGSALFWHRVAFIAVSTMIGAGILMIISISLKLDSNIIIRILFPTIFAIAALVNLISCWTRDTKDRQQREFMYAMGFWKRY